MIVINFIKESFEELRQRVTWPKYGELQNSSILVIIASIIFAIVIGSIDAVFDLVLGWFYKTF